jgi:hypothetical protein
MLEYAYNWQLRIENTHVSKTVKILSVSITELMFQAKAWEKSNPEVPHILKALRSNESLLSCEWAINQITLSTYSPRCLQHCDVVVRIYVEE